jgi:16S rRNA (cytosine1402-N4)-methyltransferase
VDTADRGFSFLRDGPLDMRMDPAASLSAADAVNTWPEAELGRVIKEYGEERYWRAIARRWGVRLASGNIRQRRSA